MTGIHEEQVDGNTTVRWDDDNRVVTRWLGDGTLVEGYPRPYDPDEVLIMTERERAELDLAETAVETNRLATIHLPAMEAILAQTNADLRADPSQEIKDLAAAVRSVIKRLNHLLDAGG